MKEIERIFGDENKDQDKENKEENSSIIFCDKCGARYHEKVNFCRKCGNKLT